MSHPSGIVMLITLLHSEKASCPMVITPFWDYNFHSCPSILLQYPSSISNPSESTVLLSAYASIPDSTACPLLWHMLPVQEPTLSCSTPMPSDISNSFSFSLSVLAFLLQIFPFLICSLKFVQSVPSNTNRAVLFPASLLTSPTMLFKVQTDTAFSVCVSSPIVSSPISSR